MDNDCANSKFQVHNQISRGKAALEADLILSMKFHVIQAARALITYYQYQSTRLQMAPFWLPVF